MTPNRASAGPSRSPTGRSSAAQPDLGYHWIWTYGHLISAAVFSLAATLSTFLNGPMWLTVTAVGCGVWSAVGFWVMRFVVRMNELGTLPTPAFAPGATRVLDLGCGAGRTSVIVARERPESRIVALDNFSADYIRGRRDRDSTGERPSHGEKNTRENFQAAGVESQIDIQSGDMRRIPCPDSSFDGVVSSTAIDHLERSDIPIALAEANRVLNENGQILLWLIVPNAWAFIAFGPLLAMHGTYATRGDWHQMLAGAGFEIDDEGTSRGLAWILATRVREPSAVPLPASPPRRAIPRHVLWLSGGLVVGGGILRLLGLEATGLWTAGGGVVAMHVGAASLGLGALRGWLVKRRTRKA